jgi:hypothetical protein
VLQLASTSLRNGGLHASDLPFSADDDSRRHPFLTPIVVLVLILDKAFDLAQRGLKPVAAMIPARLASEVTTEAGIAIVVIVLLCFFAGLLARTRLAQI